MPSKKEEHYLVSTTTPARRIQREGLRGQEHGHARAGRFQIARYVVVRERVRRFVFNLVVSGTQVGLRATYSGPKGVFTSDNDGSPTLPDVPRRLTGGNPSDVPALHPMPQAERRQRARRARSAATRRAVEILSLIHI